MLRHNLGRRNLGSQHSTSPCSWSVLARKVVRTSRTHTYIYIYKHILSPLLPVDERLLSVQSPSTPTDPLNLNLIRLGPGLSGSTRTVRSLPHSQPYDGDQNLGSQHPLNAQVFSSGSKITTFGRKSVIMEQHQKGAGAIEQIIWLSLAFCMRIATYICTIVANSNGDTWSNTFLTK